jgi:hypothetical protein
VKENEGKFDFLALVVKSFLGREVSALAGDGGGWGGAVKLGKGDGAFVVKIGW